MQKTAFLFPGQGSQISGMGKDFYQEFSAAKIVFEKIDHALNYKLSDIIFNGTNQDLTLTKNTQPALMAVSIAILETIYYKIGHKNIAKLADYVCGHSLGEYSALAAVQSLTIEETAFLLSVRGNAMQEACLLSNGAMAACLGIGIQELNEILLNVRENNPELSCQIANDNSQNQIVISGDNKAIDEAIKILGEKKFKAIKLNVNGAFHSPLMKTAEEKMSKALLDIEIKTPLIPIINNVTAKATTDVRIIKNSLLTQITSPVRWRETLDKLASLDVKNIVEIGSGKVLTGMIRKSNYQFKLFNISNIEEMNFFLRDIEKF